MQQFPADTRPPREEPDAAHCRPGRLGVSLGTVSHAEGPRMSDTDRPTALANLQVALTALGRQLAAGGLHLGHQDATELAMAAAQLQPRLAQVPTPL
jgi:hypothetical protein